MKSSSVLSSSFVYSLFLACLLLDRIETTTARIPFLSKRQKKYTPLVFFTVPKGLIAECDELEKVVSQVEKDLGVRVERLDVLRDPAAEATLHMLSRRPPPLLYHRESCQTVHVPIVDPDKRGADSSTPAAPVIDKARVRAWAKGRFLAPPGVKLGQVKSKAPVLITKDDNALDQEELMKDATLTPVQLKGKEAMKARTAEKAKEISN